ncbi:hypothetical protein [Noviherbaspirillum humi]|uniref:hypothetical protein n=1 Tax=Noviherbaspirillum humi TaxID=1688639 RepID=UPI000B778770|nr:hypothetical protein [Noviherbaspirillum humi]
MVTDVAVGQRDGFQAVLLVVDSGLRAADDAALEIGFALDAELEAAVVSPYGGLPAYAGVVIDDCTFEVGVAPLSIRRWLPAET